LKIKSYLIECGICYLCLCEKSYPKKLAFSFLEELQVEFQSKYGTEVGTVARPYAFVKFGMIKYDNISFIYIIYIYIYIYFFYL